MNLAQLIEANWPIVGVVLLLVLLLVTWLIGRATRSKARDRRPDVLDEGAAPAQRNQALIDAPPAAAVAAPLIVPSAAGGTFAGVAEVIARGAQHEAQVQAPTVETSQAASAPAGEADDLRRIKGLGPKLVTTLQALGITRYVQIAAWTDADLDDLDTKLGAFAGRPRRDSWVEQAQLLAGGDTAAYEAKFGKL
jgi:predicted flap endonuclease-1-like 5' DNA nuclease